MIGKPSEDEALRLVLAFYCIMEPGKRAELLALAENLASQSQAVELAPHVMATQAELNKKG